MKENKARLYVITGPSGVGKGTVLNKFFEHNKDNIIYSISATTRAPRPQEKDRYPLPLAPQGLKKKTG